MIMVVGSLAHAVQHEDGIMVLVLVSFLSVVCWRLMLSVLNICNDGYKVNVV